MTLAVSEESDEISKGSYLSHFEMYRKAMKVIGVSTSKIDYIITTINKNGYSRSLLSDIKIPQSCKDFMINDIKVAKSNDLAEIIGVFCIGKETIIPSMFKQIVKSIPKSNKLLINYFHRHIDIDDTRHGPLSKKMLKVITKTKMNEHKAYESGLKSPSTSETAGVNARESQIKTSFSSVAPSNSSIISKTNSTEDA